MGDTVKRLCEVKESNTHIRTHFKVLVPVARSNNKHQRLVKNLGKNACNFQASKSFNNLEVTRSDPQATSGLREQIHEIFRTDSGSITGSEREYVGATCTELK